MVIMVVLDLDRDLVPVLAPVTPVNLQVVYQVVNLNKDLFFITKYYL